MSRSYKHTPIAKQKNCKFMKNAAVRALRHFGEELANGNAYKKLFNSWNICDWSFLDSFHKFYASMIESFRLRYPNKSERELDKLVHNEYRKSYLSK